MSQPNLTQWRPDLEVHAQGQKVYNPTIKLQKGTVVGRNRKSFSQKSILHKNTK